MNRRQPRNAIGMRRSYRSNLILFAIEFVLNLTHEFFEYTLEGDNADDAAEFIYSQRHVKLRPQHALQGRF